MDEKHMLHNVILENKAKLSISGVCDVDTFDESQIILYTETDTLEVSGENLHIQKLNVADGELIIEGEVEALIYTGTDARSKKGKGFFKRMLK
ncbi:MAG: sporulation protein YabP [Clostridia bacterium]|nr:sporulation protein YabP [Clostridia bacterium]